MEIEYEATFEKINKTEIRKRLKNIGAKKNYSEFLQKRSVFNLPKENLLKGAWLRVRQEKDKITMSLKIIDGGKIENQKEICLKIDDFKKAEDFLILLGCQKKAYQENKRELWKINEVDITIDEWPFLEPFIEIEGNSEKKVKEISQKLGFDYKEAIFCSVDFLYGKKYNLSLDVINNKISTIVFEMKNPFISYNNHAKH